MDPKLQQVVADIRNAASTLENSEFAHLVKEDAIALYKNVAAALERLHELVTAKPNSV